ncbi:GNAT family N-acetyltransferase [Myxococcota bacterium]|nr:GNAT family N-acetyltransferase [Myxococcota bacterium]MBU1495496.1 GNAT family N-acetyltransferase [Myxococcota bacterium]
MPRLQEIYESRITDVKAAFSKVRPGNKVFIGSAASAPRYLVTKMGEFPLQFADTEIMQMVSLESSPFTDGKHRDMFRLNTFFIGRAARESVASGNADYTPIFMSEIPRLIHTGAIPIDVALIQVTPPDPFGNCSLGVSVETSLEAVRRAKYVIAQVNENMPRTFGNSMVSVEDLDAVILHDEPILEYSDGPTSDAAERIGFYISRLIPNGSTIQAGIGAIPNAVLRHLTDKRNLGVHTEMFSDGLIELYESGAITNHYKKFHPGKITAAFCVGSQKLYDMVNNNPVFEFYPTDYLSDPRNISMNDNMCAINAALEVDVTGQVCADSIGSSFYSGIGGQADFIRGASLAKNGRPIIALPSTAKNGTISRIVPTLKSGAGVVTTRGDVHYVVTEYGIAYIHGKNIRDRVMALINIAHPKFRSWLLQEAKKLNYIYQDQELPREGTVYPEHYRWDFTASDGEVIHFRPIRLVDEEKLRRFFYGLREEDIYYRFMGFVRTLNHSAAQPLIVMDYEEKFGLVGYIGDEPDDKIVAVGRWFLDRPTNRAEVAFTILPEWQGKGIGSHLLEKLIQLAREKGIRGFTAEVLADNRKMLNVFYRSGYSVKSLLEYNVYSLTFDFHTKSEFTNGY